MTKLLLAGVIALVPAPCGMTDDKQESTPAERLKQLKAKHDAIEKTFEDELRADRTNEGVSKANDKYRRSFGEWEQQALAAVRQSPKLPEAFEVMTAILDRSSVDLPELVGLIRKYHAARADLGTIFHSLTQSRQKEGPAFVEEMAEKSPVDAVRAQAAYDVGWQAKWRILQDGEERFGFGGELTEVEHRRLESRAEKYLNMAANYDKAPMAYGIGKVGPTARGELLGLKNIANLQIGKVAPDIVGEGIDGKKIKLSDQRGKVTVVVFWASWCGPCMKMVPHEKKLVDRLKDRPFALVGINGDDERDKAQAAAKRTAMTWPSFWDAAERPDGPITKCWNVSVWPTIYVLDSKGVIRFKGTNGKELDKAVEDLLKEMERK